MAVNSNVSTRRVDGADKENTSGSLKSESRLIRLECLKIVKERALTAQTAFDAGGLIAAAKELESWVRTGK